MTGSKAEDGACLRLNNGGWWDEKCNSNLKKTYICQKKAKGKPYRKIILHHVIYLSVWNYSLTVTKYLTQLKWYVNDLNQYWEERMTYQFLVPTYSLILLTCVSLHAVYSYSGIKFKKNQIDILYCLCRTNQTPNNE